MYQFYVEYLLIVYSIYINYMCVYIHSHCVYSYCVYTHISKLAHMTSDNLTFDSHQSYIPYISIIWSHIPYISTYVQVLLIIRKCSGPVTVMCVEVCVCVCMCVCMCVCVYIKSYVQVSTGIRKCNARVTVICGCMCVRFCMCMCLCMCVRTGKCNGPVGGN